MQDELQFVKKELKNSTTEYERSSRALRILSGRIAFLEMECGSLGLQVDSFDMERCELYRENLTLMDTISEQVLEIDGLRRLIKKLEKNSSQTSGTKQEIKMVKEVANNSQSDAQISMVMKLFLLVGYSLITSLLYCIMHTLLTLSPQDR